MKTIKFTLLAVLILISQLTFSQWKTTGNAVTGSEKLGTTNQFPLNFITNKTQQMTITAGGSVGIGTTAPKAKLHIANGSTGVLNAYSGSTIVTESLGENYINLLTPVEKESGIIFGNNLSPGQGNILYNSIFNPRGMTLIANNGSSSLALTKDGFVGIKLFNPKTELHVFRGNSGVSAPNPNSPVVVESPSDNFINILNPGNRTSGILFGNSSDAQEGGIIYNSIETTHGIQFNTNGNVTRMVISNTGFVGVNTKSPKTELHIIHGDGFNHGLRLENSAAPGKDWTFYTFKEDGSLGLFFKNVIQGWFEANSGSYFSLSDERRKKDIEKAPDVMSKVLQLNVKKYHFLDNKSNDNKYYGMIAQEVEKVLPEVVFHRKLDGAEKDVYTMNYSAFGVIAIKALQEQEGIIEKQESTIEQQQTAIEKLQADMAEIKEQLKASPIITHSSNTNATISLSSAHLTQNTPNPFTTSTTIQYSIPERSKNAAIEIVSTNGQVIKTYPITGKGEGQVTVKGGELTAGTYYYVLKVDGAKLDSKQMVLLK